MSYNYLPLDKKELHFFQIKNLLDYQQMLSITFDAHEQILKSADFVNLKLLTDLKVSSSSHNSFNCELVATNSNMQSKQIQDNFLLSSALIGNTEMHELLVRLLIMLKIKGLSYGHSGVQINTVIRLMELYNNNVFPVIFDDAVATNNLVKNKFYSSIIGLGYVIYNGEKMETIKALELLDLKPLQHTKIEALALINGNEFITAYGLYCLKKVEPLLLMADKVAAAFGIAGNSIFKIYSSKLFTAKLSKGEMDTVVLLNRYSSTNNNRNKLFVNEVVDIIKVHGACKDAFNYVLGVFMAETNAVVGNPLFFEDDDLIFDTGNITNQHLVLALQFLTNAIGLVASLSKQRSSEFLVNESFFKLSQTENATVNVDVISLSNTANTCWQLITITEQLLALETRIVETKQ